MHKCAVLAGFALLFSLVGPEKSWAALGGDFLSVQNDRTALVSDLASTSVGSFTVHELRLNTGTTVREYQANATGVIFGVAWFGPSIPNLQQILGASFDSYRNFAKSHVGLGPVRLMTPDLVVQSGGHMRAFSGQAYLPKLLPPGVTSSDIK